MNSTNGVCVGWCVPTVAIVHLPVSQILVLNHHYYYSIVSAARAHSNCRLHHNIWIKTRKKNNKMKIIPVEVQRLHGTATINEHPHTRNNSSLNVGWKQHVQSYNIPRAFLHLAQTSGHHTPKTITTNIIISNGQASQEKTATAAAKRANTSKLYRNQEKNESKTEHTLSQDEKKEEEENARRSGNQKIRDGWKR